MSKEYVPRLLWLNLDWSLAYVHQHIFYLYKFMLESDSSSTGEEDHSKDNVQYKDYYEKMLEAIQAKEEMNENWFDMDATPFPFVLNVANPNKSRNYFNPCRICRLKNCNNCALPIGKSTTTLRQFLEEITHKTKFNSNDNLFRNVDDLREEENNEKPEQSDSKQGGGSGWTSLGFQNSSNNNNWTNSSSINADNDDDNDSCSKKQFEDDSNEGARHRVFALELVFVNRVIDKSVEYYNKVLMGFDSYPGKKDHNHNKGNSGKHKQKETI